MRESLSSEMKSDKAKGHREGCRAGPEITEKSVEQGQRSEKGVA